MRCTTLDHGREEYLRKYRAELAHSRAESVACAAHSCWENLSGRDKCRGVGAKVEEELREHVEREEMSLCQTSPGETEDAENDSQHGEAADLDGSAPDFVDG